MWIVQLALRRPYTFVAAAILIAIPGGISITRIPTDILPDIDVPVVSAIWQYRGLSPEELAQSERSFTATVNDIEHIESQTIAGMGGIKVFFHPGMPVDTAVARITAISQTVTRQMPPGATPPLILRFNASSVPILQLASRFCSWDWADRVDPNRRSMTAAPTASSRQAPAACDVEVGIDNESVGRWRAPGCKQGVRGNHRWKLVANGALRLERVPIPENGMVLVTT